MGGVVRRGHGGRARLAIDIAVFTAAVYAATVAIQIYQPATGGYFNLGESVIYVAALLKSPLVAAFAGGVGAALADISTGYGIFAPGTLIIKFIEGFVAGTLIRKLSGKNTPFIHNLLTIIACILYPALIVVFATIYWAGEAYYGPSEFLMKTLEPPLINIPLFLWIIIAFSLAVATIYVLLKRLVKGIEPPILLIAGFIMVLGYFLYEFFYSNPATGRDPWAATAEIPINIGQAVIGASIAIPVSGWLRRAGYGKQT
ncbi:MAG: ECF transporter S component [Desulfurococcaceae archaeon]